MLKPGQKLAQFEILNKLGEGGMGAVFLARDTKLERKVALKVLTGELFDDANRLERFKREARTAAQISNAYVMSTFDIGQENDPESGEPINYIVLEYVEGRPLNEYVKEERPILTASVRLAEKIASGLAAAHKLNIVHRDIKPDNILIDDSGDPKILDFGLAKPIDPVQFESTGDGTQTVSEELTKVGKIMGTVSYMSPEQVRGDKVDTRSDIFAFGILLYRMVTGDLPFTGPTQVETMAKILESSFDPPRTRNDAIPPELERIITKCLQKDPEERYQSSRDLVVDLRNVRRQFDSGVTDTITKTSTGLTAAVSTSLPRRTSLITGLAVIAAALIWAFWGRGDDVPVSRGLQAKENSLAIIGFENKTGDSELDWLETGLPEILLTDLAQNQEISIISQQRILDCFDAEVKKSHTHEQCVQAAQSLGATRLLSGAFYKLGDKIRIDARLEDVGTGNIVLAEKVIGDDAFGLVDSLTAKVAAALNLTQTGDLQKLAGSPEAYKPFHLGMELFAAGDYEPAIANFEEAITVDTGFALPYMRIGMSNIFLGRPGLAAQFFQQAQARQDRLPMRDRRILDAYYDTWVSQEFDRAFGKLEAMVRDYPEDAEIRTIYALFLNVFKSDTTATFAQLDTVLATYPTFAFALDQYAILLRQNGNLERSAYFVQRLVDALPNSVDPRINLINLRLRQDKLAEALLLAERLHEQFPEDQRPLYRLISLTTNLRQFDEARRYAEELGDLADDDPFEAMQYHNSLANIDGWEGQFKASIVQRQRSLEQAHQTGDSAQVFAILSAIGDYYRRFEMIDSMEVYEEEAYKWATQTNRVGYPLRMIAFFPEREAELRPIFEEVMDDFRARFPREFWSAAKGLEMMFEAGLNSDTVAIIEALDTIMTVETTPNSENVFQLGMLLAETGEYAKAKELLARFLSGSYRTSNFWRYQLATYYLGRANEGLGNTGEAVEQYTEFLKYWGNADIQIKSITEAKARLARLTS